MAHWLRLIPAEMTLFLTGPDTELGSVRQVYFWLHKQQVLLPVAQGPEDAQEIIRVWLL